MKKDGKLLKPIITALGAIALIVSGSVIFGNKEKTENDSTSNGGDNDKIATSNVAQTNLTVSANKCRGCGKCVRIDPEHFALDVENRVAIVISMENLGSESLQLAANNCDGAAIVIS